MDQENSRRCEVCGGPFNAKRSDKKTCSAKCRKEKSRRKLDPDRNSPERKHRRRLGLDQKYVYSQHAEALDLLQRLGLVPLGNAVGPNPSRSQLQRDNARGSVYHPATYDPILWHNRKLPAGRWAPPDGWWQHETLLGLRNALPGIPDGRLLVHADSPLGRLLWPPDETLKEAEERYYENVKQRWGLPLETLPYAHPSRIRWVRAANGTVWPTRTSVTEHTKGEEMLATEERTALDIEELVQAINGVLAIALRLQARYPSSQVLQGVVNRLIAETLSA